MAAMDLVKILVEYSEKQFMDEQIEKKVCSAFLSHLNDKNLDVQTNAVKNIQKTASLLRDSNLVMLVE